MNKNSHETHSAYYSSPESHSQKMKTYISFFVAAEEGDTKTMSNLSTEDITWDFNAGSKIVNGLPWVGLFKGQKAILEVSQKIKPFKIEVLSREYYLISETEGQLIIFAKDDIKIFDSILIPNINFANVITFQNNKISYIKTVEDNSRLTKAYEIYQEDQAIKAWE